MKKWLLATLVIIIIVLFFIIGFKITGRVVQEQHQIGPSASEQACMMACMKCTSIGVNCSGDSATCQAQCNIQKPESTSETSCMESCVLEGCSQYDFSCQNKNQESCEQKCNMQGDKPDESTMSAEQLCITNCVESKAPGTRCQASQTGETGGSVCQECAASCVHLYEGPCLDEEKLESKKKECETCENCYGEPVMGDSGEGWECIVNVECKDASSEFGDESGTGEGIIASVGETIGNIAESIGNFFSNIFSSGESASES
jgi:uncharacterized protein YneF (UPF0154 family)